jgi:hypothetical protein
LLPALLGAADAAPAPSLAGEDSPESGRFLELLKLSSLLPLLLLSLLLLLWLGSSSSMAYMSLSDTRLAGMVGAASERWGGGAAAETVTPPTRPVARLVPVGDGAGGGTGGL